MKKGLILLSVAAAFSVSAFAGSVNDEIASLKAQLAKLEKQVQANKKKASEARMMANGNHIKWDVDFRTTNDKIEYTLANGQKVKNSSLLSNRLLINMKYDAGDHVRFYGTLAFNKAFGATLNGQPTNMNYRFDWVTNEALADDIGQMSDRILVMADKIGEMADRIVETEKIMDCVQIQLPLPGKRRIC
jgi:hypothetical protein